MQHKMHIVSRSPSMLSSASSSNSSIGKQSGTTSNSSLGKQSDTTYKSRKSGHSNQGENVKMGYKIRPKVSTKVGVAVKATPPRKLTLGEERRDINHTRKRTITNKEVDNGDELNAAAKNIESRKVMPMHQTMEGGKNRSIGRKLWGDRSKIYGSRSGSEKVILRHQNVEGKKQNPRWYNNVIEETASMLAELRKSKVKALVVCI
ncbi:Calmodulin-binding domain, plant [Sesbania bispinosa]|nr:Calmodulin-binding domain, plant [Sesbania bispinosa]